MITIFGATGFTGRIIAEVLAREGQTFRLAGRSAEKLAALSDNLPGQPAWLVADARQPASLPPLFQDTQVLINVAGPFTDLGEPVISRAAMGGVHYLDMTNELGFVFRMRSYHTMAARTGAAMVPAAGFEVALADFAASLVVERMGGATAQNPVDQIDVVYALGGTGVSAGTKQSMVRTMATSWIAYRYGDWIGQVPGGRTRAFYLPIGKRRAISFPSSETVTLPAHIPVTQIDTWMTAPSGVQFWGPIAIPVFARLSRSILRPLFLKIASWGDRPTDGTLDSGARADAKFTILVRAQRGPAVHWMSLQGQDPYGITAEIIAYLARRMTTPGYDRAGMLAPAQAVDPAAILHFSVENWGLKIKEGESVG